MKETKSIIKSFDILRTFFITSIILYHARSLGIEGLPSGYLAVECFFIISGYLLCNSYNNDKQRIENNSDLFKVIIYKRFIRLYPEYFFVLILTLIIFNDCFSTNALQGLGYNLIMFGHLGMFDNIVPGSWYVGALFWASFIVICFLSLKNAKIIYAISPLLILWILTILYKTRTESLIRASDIPFIYMSAGILRGLAGLLCGVTAYYFANNDTFIKKVNSLRNKMFSLIIYSLLLLTLYLFIQNKNCSIFNIYIVMTLLIAFLGCKPKWSNSIFSWKIWHYFYKISYMLFLTNILVIDTIKKYLPYKEYPQSLVYLMVMVFCIVFAFICYHVQKWLFAKLKDILFVNTPQTASQNISGEH